MTVTRTVVGSGRPDWKGWVGRSGDSRADRRAGVLLCRGAESRREVGVEARLQSGDRVPVCVRAAGRRSPGEELGEGAQIARWPLGRGGWIQGPRGGLAPAERRESSDGEVPKAPLPLRSATAQQAEISVRQRERRQLPGSALVPWCLGPSVGAVSASPSITSFWTAGWLLPASGSFFWDFPWRI